MKITNWFKRTSSAKLQEVTHFVSKSKYFGMKPIIHIDVLTNDGSKIRIDMSIEEAKSLGQSLISMSEHKEE